MNERSLNIVSSLLSRLACMSLLPEISKKKEASARDVLKGYNGAGKRGEEVETRSECRSGGGHTIALTLFICCPIGQSTVYRETVLSS